jgi:class 3 adenylate cyclase/WD40 repeat protein/RecA/RadA recombinase
VYPVTDSQGLERDRRAAIHTFLIADVRGYTSFTGEHGDEAASRLTAKFAEVAREGIEAWAGSLVETRGDEVLAAFDSVRNALRCAVELQAAFAAETLADPSLPLSVGIGVAAGEAVAIGDGYRGAALNVAARLCSTASGGEVIARADLVHLAGTMPDMGLIEVGPLTLKGLDEPVQAVRVESATPPTPPPVSPAETLTKGPRPPLPPELDPLVPLAGRNADLSWLAWHWRRAGHGAGRVVVISGPPGMGKTRLAAELAGRAHAEGAAVTYLAAARGADEIAAPEPAAGMRLLIIDDLDAAPPALGEAVVQLGGQIAAQRTLVLVTHRQEAAPALVAVAERLASPERRRVLQPLGPDGIAAIAALYAGHGVTAVPLPQALTETGGIPAAIHRWSSAWARQTASERLGASATRTSTGRRNLRAAETELMGSYAALALARDRTELFGADRPADEDEAGRPAVEVCPYKGLASFDAADADFFFGRERLVAELVTRLVGTGFLALVGASGSGKSSALRAGLLPALAGGVLPGSDTWRQIVLRPGEHPLTELGRALARVVPSGEPLTDTAALLERALSDLPAGGRLVLVVDQFEEVFNATRVEEEKEAFIDLLTSEREGLKVVVCLRADHYGHCAAYPELASLLGANQVLVGPPTKVELAEVIEHPAQRVGLRVEDGLTDALLEDLGDEPGSLPLLSTALLELWQSREQGRLTLAAYRASGGVQAAVARLAETAYRGLDEEQQRLARSVFLRLAGPGEGEGVVRRRVPLGEFDTESNPQTAAVIDVLTNARLLSSGDGYVEVAHEALMREWPRLRGWLEEDSAGHQLRLHLTDSAREWDERGRPPDELYRGARLAAAIDWQPEHDQELNALERDFLTQSRLVSERQAERQRTINRRLRMLLAGAAVFLVVAVGAGAFAAYQAQVAHEAEDFARSRELAASAIAALDQDPALSKLLALEAASIANPPIESLAALHTAWDADRIVYRYQWPADKPLSNLMTDIDPSGRYIVASGFLFAAPHDRLEVFDRQQDAVAWSFQSADSSIAVGNGYFTPDGSRVVFGAYREQAPPASAGSATDDAGVHVRDPGTGAELNHFSIGPCGGAVVAASNVSAMVLTFASCLPAGSKPELKLVDLASGETRLLTSHEYGNDEGPISTDGKTVAYTQTPQSNDQVPETYVVDVASGVQTRVDPPAVDPSTLFVHDVDPSGQYLLLSEDGLMKVWDIAAAQVVAESPPVVGSNPGYANFSRDGSTVYWTSQDGMLYLWQPANQSSDLRSYPVGPQGGLPSSTDAGLVLVPSWGTQDAVLIDTTQHPEIADLPPPSGCGVYFPEGLNVAGGNVSVTSLCNGTPLLVARVADRASLAVSRVLPGGAVMAISPDGSRLARQTGRLVQPDDPTSDIEAGPLEIVDVGSGATLQLEGLCSYNWSGEGGESHQPAKNPGCAEFPAEPFELYTWRLRWSPDGSMLVAVDADQAYWAVWNTHDGSLIGASTAVARPGAFDARFTADSSHLVVSYTGSSADYGATVADTLESISTTSWTVDAQRTLTTQGLRLELVGLTDDGATILAVSGSTGTGVERAGTGEQGIYWLAADTLEESRPSRPSLHIGTLNTVTLNDQGTLLATGSADGTVSVWDATDGRLVHQLNFPNNEISSLGFLTDSHLGVLLDDGNLKVVTTDPDELLRIVRQSLTRGFTAAECERYNFDPCPTLAQMRGD